MRKLTIAAIFLTGLFGQGNTTHADALGSRFGGAISHSCTLVATLDGIMTPNAASTQLSSRSAGGRAARVTAQTTARGYRVRTIAPTAFTVSPAPSPSTFTSWYQISGATTRSLVNGNTLTTLNRGTNNMRVHLRARRSGGNVFANGNYEAIVTVRCE
jgi:hypothetical protein